MSRELDYIPVRLSHLFRHCAPGAVVRGVESLVVVPDIRHWPTRNGRPSGRLIAYVERVRDALGLQQELREPPIAAQTTNGQIEGVPIRAQRFPRWARCPNPECGHLYFEPWRRQPEPLRRCIHCGTQRDLEQVPWVLVHGDGSLADVPWHFLAHRDPRDRTQRGCREDRSKSHLCLIETPGGGYTLGCTQCIGTGAGTTPHDSQKVPRWGAMSQFSEHAEVRMPRGVQQPWLSMGEEEPLRPSQPDPPLAKVLPINDVRVHQPHTRTVLVIPPESRIRRGTIVDRLYHNQDMRARIARARPGLARRSALAQASAQLRCEVSELTSALEEIEAGYPLYGATFTPGNLLEDEYRALITALPQQEEDEDFVTRHRTPEWRSLGETASSGIVRPLVDAVDQLVEVSRLKAILVLTGFSRDGGPPVPPDLLGKSKWLPALELFGEGLFFTLREAKLAAWERTPGPQARAREFQKRLSASNLRFAKDCMQQELVVTPRFLLLHTLAHLLIRQLETAAGYPAASLTERIYHTAGSLPMAGILVYVAVPDVVGSLGGVFEQAEPQRFLSLLMSAFEHAMRCSLDPVCGKHQGQGPHQLNRAACHACALVPETSCTFENCLLDRALIRGDPERGLPPFLDFIQAS